MGKAADAFRTISEVAQWIGVPAHVLRFWESKFPQVKPVKRAGGRRYYRPADIRLLGGIKVLLHDQGMTIKGVQQLLRDEGVSHVAAFSPALEGEHPAQTGAQGAQVMSFGGTDTEPGEPSGTGAEADAPAATVPETEPEPAPEADAGPDPGPAPEPAPGSEPDPEPEPAGVGAADAPAAPLPPLPDLPPDPPDDAQAPPGPLSRIAALPRPLTPALAGRLSTLAAKLRDAGAPRS